MIEFMVLSMPRSASTWTANWLTTDWTLCLHDPILEHRPEDLDEIPCDRTLGLACTGLALLPDFVNQHPARKVIVHRDRKHVDLSLVSIGLSPLRKPWMDALDRIKGTHIEYSDLFQPKLAGRIYELLTGVPFDETRHAQLVAMHIEPNFERIAIKPDRARDFRERIERAFA